MLALLPTLLTLALAHDFHISRLTVNLDAPQARTEVTLHTFVDDVEAAVTAFHGLDADVPTATGLPAAAALDFLAPTEHPLTDSLVEAYLRHKIRLTDGGEALGPLRYLGPEAADDPYAVYFYFAAPLPAPGSALAIESRFFTELFADQQNVVVWQRGGVSEGYDLLTDRETVSAFAVPDDAPAE